VDLGAFKLFAGAAFSPTSSEPLEEGGTAAIMGALEAYELLDEYDVFAGYELGL
jgi:hypothetical protein